MIFLVETVVTHRKVPKLPKAKVVRLELEFYLRHLHPVNRKYAEAMVVALREGRVSEGAALEQVLKVADKYIREGKLDPLVGRIETFEAWLKQQDLSI